MYCTASSFEIVSDTTTTNGRPKNRHRAVSWPVRRAAAFVLLCPLILAGCRSSTPSAHQRTGPQLLAPPVIKERFTLLPCPRSRAARATTLGAEACAEKRIIGLDAEIDARARAIFRLLRDATAKRRFLTAERSWLVYRAASCRSVADVYRRGSAEPVAFADCLVSRDREHLAELAPFEAFLRRIR